MEGNFKKLSSLSKLFSLFCLVFLMNDNSYKLFSFLKLRFFLHMMTYQCYKRG